MHLLSSQQTIPSATDASSCLLPRSPVIADVLISYIQSQVCVGWAAAMGHGFDVPVAADSADASGSGGAHLLGGVGLRKGMTGPGQKAADGESSTDPHAAYYAALRVPTSRLTDRPADVPAFREVEPFCVSANDLINPLPPSLFYGSGWHAHHPTNIRDADDRHYWYAEQPTSRLRVPVRIGAGEVRFVWGTFCFAEFAFPNTLLMRNLYSLLLQVGIYYMQSGEDSDTPLGSALCWVDDNVGGGKELYGTVRGSHGEKATYVPLLPLLPNPFVLFKELTICLSSCFSTQVDDDRPRCRQGQSFRRVPVDGRGGQA